MKFSLGIGRPWRGIWSAGSAGTPAKTLPGERFVRAFAARDRFVPGDGNAPPWLFGFAVRLVNEHRRRERRQLRALARAGGDAGAVDETADLIGRADASLAARPVLERLRRQSLVHGAWSWSAQPRPGRPQLGQMPQRRFPELTGCVNANGAMYVFPTSSVRECIEAAEAMGGEQAFPLPQEPKDSQDPLDEEY